MKMQHGRAAMNCCVMSQHMSQLQGQKENTPSPIVACVYFGHFLVMDLRVTV
jgi:hypothetical protein